MLKTSLQLGQDLVKIFLLSTNKIQFTVQSERTEWKGKNRRIKETKNWERKKERLSWSVCSIFHPQHYPILITQLLVHISFACMDKKRTKRGQRRLRDHKSWERERWSIWIKLVLLLPHYALGRGIKCTPQAWKWQVQTH